MSRDPVSPADHAALMVRDGGCVLRDQPGHVCRDIWGDVIPGTRADLMTIEHVKKELRMGRRARSALPFMVLLDGYTNNKPPSKAEREVMRARLAALYPESWA